jgi:serine/threonine protein kinase/Flp pilus assembly protein TadD
MTGENTDHRVEDEPAGSTQGSDSVTRTGGATLGYWGELTLMARLGRGGFGEVYLAWDPKLAREVALKLLRHPWSDSSSRAIIREARLLARVRHPHVVTVFGADRFDGSVGLWMEYVRGRTLSQIVHEQGAFGPAEATVVGLELCRALAAVHGAGLVHGDVKAQNVIRESGGRIVLMDFGAGRELAGGTPESAVDAAGTPAYMAPELFHGSPASIQSDIYALGVLLYYLVTGLYPVDAGSSAQARAAHASSGRRLLRDVRADLPSDFLHIVERALAPDPRDRFASVGAMEAALAHAVKDTPPPRGTSLLRRPVAAALLTAVLCATTYASWSSWAHPRATPFSGTPVRSLAVLPFVNKSGGEQDYFSDGTSELLTAKLASIASIRVTSYTSTARLKGTRRTPQDLGSELHVDALLSGSVSRSGDWVRVNAQLVEARSGELLWADSYERHLTDYFVLQADLVRDMVGKIRVALSADEQRQLAERASASVEAQDAYLSGAAAMQSLSEAGLTSAVGHFKRAIELDPQYARAYAGLAYAYTVLGAGYSAFSREEGYALTRAAATRALELDERSTSGHYAMALVNFDFEYDWPGAEAHLRRAIELSPSDADAHQQLGVVLAAMGDREASIEEVRRARELDPFLPERRSTLAMVLYYARRYNDALIELQGAMQADSHLEVARFGLVRVFDAMGRPRDALAQLDRLRERNDAAAKAEHARVYALVGQRDRARALLRTLEDARASGETRVALESLAHIHVALQDRDGAFALLEQAFNERSPGLCWLKVDPRFDDLHSDPRFPALLDRLRLR